MKEKFEEFLNIGKKVAKDQQKNKNKNDILATIEKLKELKDKGTISEEEFEKSKTELLGKLHG